VEAQPLEDPSETIESLRRRLESAERLVRLFDAQVHVLERERQKLAAVVGHGDVGFLVFDASLEIVWTNEYFAKHLKAANDPSSFIGAGCHRALCRRDVVCDACPVAAAFESEATAHRELALDIDGTPRIVYVTAIPILSPKGRVDQLMVMVQDVSDLEVLRSSEARKHAILEAALDAIVIMDYQGRVVEFNPAAESMFGYARSEVLDRPLAEVIIPSHLRSAHQAGFTRFLATGQGPVLGRRIESVAMRKDGSELPVELAITRIPLDGPPSFAGHIRDLTDRKQAEGELRERDEQLRQAQRMEAIGTLAGGVAHDFNNILTAILGYTGLLKKTAKDEGVQRAVDVMEKAAKRGAVLTQQLLGFARKGKNESAPADLAAIVEEVIALLQRTIDKSIVMRRTGSAPVVVIGDPGQLQQVILNLAVNARDAMPDGGELTIDTSIVVLGEEECRRQAGMSPGSYARLTVTDTGCGISEDVRRRIFEPFFTTKELGKGTGMGLAMVYGIVQNHGGTIGVKSEVGRGTAVEIHLRHATEVTAVEAPRRSGRPAPGAGRVLVVDDEEGVRQVAADILSSLGYDVTIAADGATAVDRYRELADAIDVVLLDLAMPGMGGRECFRALKAINADVKAVLCTGYGFNVAAQQLLDEGMLGIVAKPYEIEQLSSAIAQALQVPARRRGEA
jgi:PAS domain S-box-containing protein